MRIRILICVLVASLLPSIVHGQDELIQGRRLSAWLDDLGGEEEARARAENALRQGGTNATALLLKMLFTKDTPGERLRSHMLDGKDFAQYGFSPRVHTLLCELARQFPRALQISVD